MHCTKLAQRSNENNYHTITTIMFQSIVIATDSTETVNCLFYLCIKKKGKNEKQNQNVKKSKVMRKIFTQRSILTLKILKKFL